jgi:endonuclease/exonuclease/phosphatase family metal-dependent hydrolase
VSENIQLTTVNVDQKNNLVKVVEFLNRTRPNVVCLQEIFEEDLCLFEELGYCSLYVPMTLLPVEGSELNVGFVTLYDSSIALESHRIAHYVRAADDPVVLLDASSMLARRFTEKRAVSFSQFRVGNVRFQIATTHFTWVPDGIPDEYQKRDVEELLRLVNDAGELVLCGDFNSARGKPVFDAIATALRDNVPFSCDTSIDPNIHRVKGLRAMVDGIFTTSGYRASDVAMTFGISDHAAINCRLERV